MQQAEIFNHMETIIQNPHAAGRQTQTQLPRRDEVAKSRKKAHCGKWLRTSFRRNL